MAKSTKASEKDGKEAEIPAETALPETETREEPVSEMEAAEGAELVGEAETPETAPGPEVTGDDEEAPAIAPPLSAPPPRRRGGFWALFLGGVAAAALGFGVALYLGSGALPLSSGDQAEQTAAALEAQAGNIAGIETNIAAMEERLSALQGRDVAAEIAAQIADSEARLLARIDALTAETAAVAGRVDKLDARLTEVEKRPIAEAADVSGAVAAYEKELEAMRNELAAQRTRNADLAAQVSAAAASATAEIDEAAEKARMLEARASVMRILASLESGGGFSSSLDALSGVEIPAALAAVAADGAPTLLQLQQSFAGPAREALAASLRETAGGNAGDRVSAFLRTQLGARSLSPREGGDPDAILSRAEAALGAGELQTALDEIATLPESGQAAMSEWAALVQTRLDAVEAAATLAATLNVN